MDEFVSATDIETSPPVLPNWLDQRPHPSSLMFTLIVLLLVSLFSLAAWNFPDATSHYASSKTTVYGVGEYYRLWTSLFLHADLKHLLANLFLGSILIFFLVGYFGFRLVPLAALSFGALTNALTLLSMPSEIYLIGFSGVVFWLGGLWLTLYFLISSQMSLTKRILRTLGIALFIFFPSEAFDPSVSYMAHFWGFLLGILFGLLFFALNKQKWQMQPSIQIINQIKN